MMKEVTNSTTKPYIRYYTTHFLSYTGFGVHIFMLSKFRKSGTW